MADKRFSFSETGNNIDQLANSNRRGARKKGITDSDIEKLTLTDEILTKLQYDNGLSKESVEELRKTIDKTLENYTFEKDNSRKSVMELNLEVLEQFLAAKRIEAKSPVTCYNYGTVCTKMMNNINKLYSEITTDDIRNYMNYRKIHDGVSNTTLANERMYFRSFFTWLKAEEKILKNPMDRIAPVKQDKKVIDTLSEEELEIVRCSCENERDLAIVDLLSGSGMRVSELCRLNIEDVDFEKGEVKVFGKGAKERICFLTGRAKIHLKWYIASRVDDNPALFVTTKKPYSRITKNGVEYILKEIAKRSGIPKLRLYPHKFRSTLATSLINKNVPAERIQHILGHQQIGTVEIYANLSNENLKQTHSQFVS